jgi:hypothetical protein
MKLKGFAMNIFHKRFLKHKVNDALMMNVYSFLTPGLNRQNLSDISNSPPGLVRIVGVPQVSHESRIHFVLPPPTGPHRNPRRPD